MDEEYARRLADWLLADPEAPLPPGAEDAWLAVAIPSPRAPADTGQARR